MIKKTNLILIAAVGGLAYLFFQQRKALNTSVQTGSGTKVTVTPRFTGSVNFLNSELGKQVNELNNYADNPAAQPWDFLNFLDKDGNIKRMVSPVK